jgi:hypothetical protein
MSVQIVLDVTNEYTTGSESGTPGLVKLDTGGFDYAVVQFVNPSGSIAFKHTNDSGDIQGVSDGSAVSSANAVVLEGVNLADGTGITSVAADSLVRFQSFGRYLWLDGSGEELTTVDKILVRLYKIH